MGGDYSKQAFKAEKLFSDVLMQQGKVQLDSDWNEQAAIQFRRKRAQTIDTIGRAVVPWETEHAFEISWPGGGIMLIGPGRMYVDGLLAENRGRLIADDGTAINKSFDDALDEARTYVDLPYDEQPFRFDVASETEPSVPYLVYLDVWLREVTHLKDPGIIESAVGIDTTTRMQTVWQVRKKGITSVTSPGCHDDTLAEWKEIIEPSAGRLTAETLAVTSVPDPCEIPPGGGYRGLENRLYRVEIHRFKNEDASHPDAAFKWARHNGSVATAVTNIDGTELTVVQTRWDEFRRFKKGDWVEITDDKLEFDHKSGEMALVDDVDDATNTITLTGVLSGDFPTSGTENVTDPDRNTRIRKWDQSGVVRDTTGAVVVDLSTTSDGLIPVPTSSTTSIVLEEGIAVSFDLDPTTGSFKAADYWLFEVRVGDEPKVLLDNVPPQGIHHHYARLCMFFGGMKSDCRIHWPPQIKDKSCCTVTVGDGIHSHGEYTTIKGALAALPTTGGKVCVLAGTYEEDNILINSGHDIVIEGCAQSKVIPPPSSVGGGATHPIFHIQDSTSIHIKSLEIVAADDNNGILVEQLTDGALHDIEFRDLHITAAGESAIAVLNGSDIVVQNCHVDMQDVTTEWPGIFIVADQVLVKENTVKVLPTTDATTGATTITAGRGGIQIGGTADEVRVIDNLIMGGVGNGITLGSLARLAGAAAGITGAGPWVGWVEDPNTGEYEAMGTMTDVLIEKNRIFEMGMNGIGVAGFFNLDAHDEFVSIDRLMIIHNEIRKCLNQPLPVIDDDMAESMGYGGIALADVELVSIQHNIIEENGTDRMTEPVCGIYILHAEGAVISDNRLNENGRRFQLEPTPGPRGGIHIEFAIAPTVPIMLSSFLKGKIPRQNGVPALVVNDNVVVQLFGRALTVNALGPVSITSNQFTSRGVVSVSDSIFKQVATVLIFNMGVSDEFFYLQQLLTFSSAKQSGETLDGVDISQLPAQEGLDDRLVGRTLCNGNVIFNDNQCVCDLLGTNLMNFVLGSVSIISLDDISFQNNQCECNLDLFNFTGYDAILLPVFLLGLTVRMSDNRMKEGLINAAISAFSWGLFMNTATDNQATHCLLVPNAVMDYRTFKGHNIVFTDPTGKLYCQEWFGNMSSGNTGDTFIEPGA